MTLLQVNAPWACSQDSVEKCLCTRYRRRHKLHDAQEMACMPALLTSVGDVCVFRWTRRLTITNVTVDVTVHGQLDVLMQHDFVL